MGVNEFELWVDLADNNECMHFVVFLIHSSADTMLIMRTDISPS